MEPKDIEASISALTVSPSLDTPDPALSLAREFHRAPTFGSTSGDPRTRIPVDFRTLSIHVTETQEAKEGARQGAVKELAEVTWHTLSTQDVCNRLGVSVAVGLDAPIAARRLATNGKNVISRPPRNLARKIFFYIFGGFGSLLFLASIICFIAWRPLGDPHPFAPNLALAVVLLIVIVIQAVFNAWQDWSTSNVMASIAGLLPTEILVMRNGEKFKLPAADLVSGDIVTITLGSKVPADLRLVQVSPDLRFDRSILTGESNEIAGSVDCTDHNFLESRNIALQGTLCTSGSGIGVAVALGDNTVFGRITKQAGSERPVRTTLEAEIIRFVLIIASLALTVAIIIVILWAAWLRRDYPGFINVPTLLIDCVSVAVAFIPEGLPVCVTLSLTVIAGAMRSSSILCKSLATVESLGSVNFIASDKTGTLTQNRMTVVNVAVGEATYKVADVRVKLSHPEANDDAPAVALRELVALASLCNDAVFALSKIEEALQDRKVNGDATDAGLLRFSESISSTEDSRASWKEVGKIAFNSKNKFALKLFSRSAAPDAHFRSILPGHHMLAVKGAPDVLIRRCNAYVNSDGLTFPLDDNAIAKISTIQESFAAQGQRVLMLAKKSLAYETLQESNSDLENLLMAANVDLTIVGLVALVDPPRPDTAETVRVCRRAGIRFAMVTGDFSLTAAAIARQVGIITTPEADIKGLSDLDRDVPLATIPDFDDDKAEDAVLSSIVLSGAEMMTMTESQWKQVLTFDEIVFARTTPQQKLQIVRTFQAGGCTVAVTGDGVNDAPALKQADVGVAMATGSEVAMEAADLILLSDSFSTMLTGIKYGRLCFENLRKSILYLLPAGSFSELMPVLLNVLAGVPQALSSIQMIIICVVTDVLPALSLVYEQPEADLLLRKPRDRKKDRLADIKLLLHAYLFIGVLESLTSMTAAFYFGFQQNGVPFSAMFRKYGGYNVDPDLISEQTAQAQSLYFFNLVIMQWFNLLSTRTRRLSIFQQNPMGSPATRNLLLFPAMLAALLLACFFSYVPWFQRVFLTRGIAAQYFFLPMAYGVVLLFLDETRKWWNRKHPKSSLACIAW
ncbi:Calcium ATPase [Mycena indigotica]|uniref:Calcium ATPase n=1 Tax=Mycena indigotica TaxID=2126181 RepID=A0A8H6W0G6_9AGAR|nr:Calcium ATPase [Mycena indigotica]KAF7300959.1 Calcium ATPase [Mycena indigotica]